MFVSCCQEANRSKPDPMGDTRAGVLIQHRHFRLECVEVIGDGVSDLHLYIA